MRRGRLFFSDHGAEHVTGGLRVNHFSEQFTQECEMDLLGFAIKRSDEPPQLHASCELEKETEFPRVRIEVLHDKTSPLQFLPELMLPEPIFEEVSVKVCFQIDIFAISLGNKLAVGNRVTRI